MPTLRAHEYSSRCRSLHCSQASVNTKTALGCPLSPLQFAPATNILVACCKPGQRQRAQSPEVILTGLSRMTYTAGLKSGCKYSKPVAQQLYTVISSMIVRPFVKIVPTSFQ